jgi:hypothetical protein
VGVTHPWEFGWEALVAIGTIGLATVTGYLAWTTRGLARETAAEVAAQSRPVLIPGERLNYRLTSGVIEVPVRNVGGGPALFVRTEMDPGGGTADVWNLGAMAPGDEQILRFTTYDFEPHKQVLIDYRDMSGRQFSSAIVLERLNDGRQGGANSYRFYDVRIFSGKRITGQGDALPQKGLRSLPPEG